jgi:hypothetical protein
MDCQLRLPAQDGGGPFDATDVVFRSPERGPPVPGTTEAPEVSADGTGVGTDEGNLATVTIRIRAEPTASSATADSALGLSARFSQPRERRSSCADASYSHPFR